MKETEMIDHRIRKIATLLEQFLMGRFSHREAVDDHGDELNQILVQLNRLGEKIQESGKAVKDYAHRVEEIMSVLLRYTLFDFAEKATITGAGDELDAVALGLNTLGEELNGKIEAERLHVGQLEKLASIVETTADAVVSLDRDLRIELWNRSAEQMYGFRMDDVRGKMLTQVFAENGAPQEIQDALDRMLREKKGFSSTMKRRTAAGKTISVAYTLTPVIGSDGSLLSVSELSRDITQQMESERRLRLSEERFRTLVSSVRDYAMISLDRDGCITAWNEGATAMHGYTEEEMIGKHFSLFFTEEDRKLKEPERLISEAVAHSRASDEGYRMKRSGEKFWASVVINCIRNRKNEVFGFSHITRDLTETKRKDDEIREYTRRLEQKNIELEKKNRELASFAYVSSHDLQEPLRKIQTFADRILDTEEDNLSGAGRDYFRRIESSAGRMQQLIRDLLDYSSLNSPREKLQMHELNDILDEVTSEFKDRIRELHAEIHVENLCKIPVMSFQFRQLMGNLISNSLKFCSPSRPPQIRIRSEMVNCDAVHVRIPTEAKQFCHIIYSDNGIGFEPRFNQQIFEVFQRLHGQEKYPGTGIGLAICKKIVENHNGVIEASGKPEEGATFHIYLPVTEIPEQ
jgi:PAS domain S-box-containing protein